MSHTLHLYPKPTAHGLTLNPQSPWMVCEDKDDDFRSLSRLHDAVTERLAKAEALTRLLIGNDDHQRDGIIPNAAWAIADLIDEARELYAEQWEEMRKYAKLES